MKRQATKQMIILLLAFYFVLSLKCGENEIEGCSECDSGINSSKCKTCENKYFLVLEGERCVKCDDPLLAMKGCGGNCEMIKSERNVKCEENKCKEGFYEISPGICSVCSFLYSSCNKCSFLKPDGKEEKEFKCLECENNYYLSTTDNTCKYCYLYDCHKCLNETFCQECNAYSTLFPNGTCIYNINNCKTMIYSNEKGKEICSECRNGYALYPNGTCVYHSSNCKKAIYSEEKGMSICSECNDDSILLANGNCKNYDYYCINTVYSQEKDTLICTECKEGYFINKEGECTLCSKYQYDYSKDFIFCENCHLENNLLLCDSPKEGYYIYSSGERVAKCSNQISGCNKCSYHSQEDLQNGNLKCDVCQSGSYLSSDNLSCKPCNNKENGCLICSDDETQTICDQCAYGYIMTKDGSCINCEEKFGEGCSSCSLSKFYLLPYCSGCNSGYTLGNDGKCKHCENDANLVGCNSCKPLGPDAFYCISCKDDYVLMDGKCIEKNDEEFPNCKEVENLGDDNNPVYSCKECKYWSYIFVEKEKGAKECVNPSDSPDLYMCYLGRKESIGENNYTCIKCNSNYQLAYDETKKKETCSTCSEGYYKTGNTENFNCRSCSYDIYNCLKCHQEEGNVLCDECKQNYILSKNNRCLECPNNCLKCPLNENSEVKCEEYKIPLFLNKNSQVDSCLNYIDNCGKCSYSVDGKIVCDQCLEDYFKNKDGSCEHCYINKDVSPSCISCTDDEDLKKLEPCQKCNGNNYFLTKENTCIYCKSEDYGGSACSECGYIDINGKEKIGCIKCYDKLTIDGKCLKIYVTDCEQYGPYKNENNIIVYGCIKCYENYNLTDEHECKKIKVDKVINPEPPEKVIEGCLQYNYKYDSWYCTDCKDKYFLINGICIKYISHPLLSYSCLYSKSYGKDINFYLAYDKVCNNGDSYYNKYYGYCYEYENIGSTINPIYSCKKCGSYDYETTIYENGVNACAYDLSKDRCIKAEVNTYYYTNIYTCLECENLYFLSYSEYYERKVCKYIYEDEPTKNSTIYDSDTGIPTNNGNCNDKYFTRNGKVCIKCDDENNGMPGCDGKCTFKLNRQYQLKCESGKCKENYFETLPGKCDLCNNAISGCEKCEYISGDEPPIFKPVNKRKLVCNKCREGLILSNGKCLSCNDFISGCQSCIEENNQIKCTKSYNGYYLDRNGNIKYCQSHCDECSLKNIEGIDKLICTKAYLNYYVDKDGNPQQCEDHCEKCSLINENGENEVKCQEPDYGYFIDKDKKIKLCSDKNEGIIGCRICEFDSELKCSYCSNGYKKVGNGCKSIEELYSLEGCLDYMESNGTYYCTYCKEDYLYITNLKICVKKTQETKLCVTARAIRAGENTFYNCTECTGFSNILAKNLDGYFKCFDSATDSNCKAYINLGTFKEPFFICESCRYYFYISLIIDEYGNQNCLSNYYENSVNCIKMKSTKYLDTQSTYSENPNYYYQYKYNYNCTECNLKFALEYDENTQTNKCTPLECGVPFCTKCSDNDVYNCEECNQGYVFTKLGYCYIKPRKTPTIIFKDIFRFALNGLVDGNNLFRFSFYLRGLTRDEITERHSFVVSAMFSSENNLRNLEGAETLETSCEFENAMENSDDSEIKFVDYKCSLNTDKDLINDYKMESIKEGNNKDEDNLKAFDLDDLVKNVDDINKVDSNFDINELNKYILFTVDNSSKVISANNNFTIYGKTNKIMENHLFGELTFLNTDNKIANCEIDATDKDKALLECYTNLSEIVMNNQSDKLSFKEQEMKGKNNNVYFIGLNEVEIIREKEEDETDKNNDEKDKNKTGLIIGIVVGSICFVALIVILIIFLYKKRYSQKKENIEKSSQEKRITFEQNRENNTDNIGSNRNVNLN